MPLFPSLMARGALATLLLVGCTTPIVRDTTSIDAQTAQCETVDCVVSLMDTLHQGSDADRYPWMEGVKDANLTQMRKDGKLDIAPLNPLWLLTATLGYANFESGPYGGMESCSVRYLPGGNWESLKHELSHCQGYEDHGIPIMFMSYTPAQQAIMDKEGVSRWVDTSIYKTGITR